MALNLKYTVQCLLYLYIFLATVVSILLLFPCSTFPSSYSGIRAHKLLIHASKEVRAHLNRMLGAMVNHICYIYNRGIRRFSQDMGLWNHYISFLKENKCNPVLNTVYGKAMALFPKEVHFWMEAAFFELQVNQNTHAARILLQRGLRVNQSSEELWIKYFELELWYISKLHAREIILGIVEDDGSSPQSSILHAPFIVFSHAIAAIPHNMAFAFTFHSLAQSIPSLAKRIESHLRKNLAGNSDFWQHLSLSSIQSLNKAAEESSSSSSSSDFILSVTSHMHTSLHHMLESQLASVVETNLPLLLSAVLSILSSFSLSPSSTVSRDSLSLFQKPIDAAYQLINIAGLRDIHRLHIHTLLLRLSYTLGEEGTGPLHSSALEVCLIVRDCIALFSAKVSDAEIKAYSKVVLSIMESLVSLHSYSEDVCSIGMLQSLASSVLKNLSKNLLLDPEEGEEGEILFIYAIEMFIFTSDYSSAAANDCLSYCMKLVQSAISDRKTNVSSRGKLCHMLLSLRILMCPQSTEGMDHMENGSHSESSMVAAVKEVDAWLESTFQRSPVLLIDVDLTEYYNTAVDLLESQMNGAHSLKAILQRGMERCSSPSSAYFCEKYECLLRSEGNHQAANHLRWLKSKSMMVTA